MRQCKECNNEYDECEFYTQKHKRTSKSKGEYIVEYISSYCKKCDRAKSKKIKDSKEYRDRINTARRERKQNDPEYREKVNRIKRESYRRNRESSMLAHAKQRSKKMNYEFDLSVEDIIIPDICPLLKVPFVIGTKEDYTYTPTLDRIDSTKGYVKGNVWVICMLANSMKNSATSEQLLTFASSIQYYFQDDIVRSIGKPIEVEDKEPLR